MSERAPSNFREMVYAVVRQIPAGRVTSYGEVASLCGYPRHARLVGSCLKTIPDGIEEVPWQRVVNSKGVISPREGGTRATERQAHLLREEGVDVQDAGDAGDLGNGGQVNLFLYGWDGEGVLVPNAIV
ncbi:hypothetical protein PYCC9005_002528 [Savitreella phatthalungensis]